MCMSSKLAFTFTGYRRTSKEIAGKSSDWHAVLGQSHLTLSLKSVYYAVLWANDKTREERLGTCNSLGEIVLFCRLARILMHELA